MAKSSGKLKVHGLSGRELRFRREELDAYLEPA